MLRRTRRALCTVPGRTTDQCTDQCTVPITVPCTIASCRGGGSLVTILRTDSSFCRGKGSPALKIGDYGYFVLYPTPFFQLPWALALSVFVPAVLAFFVIIFEIDLYDEVAYSSIDYFEIDFNGGVVYLFCLPRGFV